MSTPRKYVITKPYTTGYCVVCSFIDEYVHSLSVREYLRAGILCCCNCELDGEEYVHKMCNMVGDDHSECEEPFVERTKRYTLEDKDIWYIEDILRVFLYYTDENKEKAGKLLQLFLEDKSALWTMD